MSISLRRLCEWKKEDGYSYVTVNEYTKELEFIREEDLDIWYIGHYLRYSSNPGNRRMDFEEFRKQNPVDQIRDMLVSDPEGEISISEEKDAAGTDGGLAEEHAARESPPKEGARMSYSPCAGCDISWSSASGDSCRDHRENCFRYRMNMRAYWTKEATSSGEAEYGSEEP